MSQFSIFKEEYLVFQVLPTRSGLKVASLVETHAAWLAGLVRLECGPLSAGEIAEALRSRSSYSPNDLFVADWAAAVVFDDDWEEVLDAIAFANLQLLEYRHIDSRLDEHLQKAYGLIQQLARTWLPFWRSHGRTVRGLGALKVESNIMFERTSSVLKLVGDPYLARAYQLLSQRFHLDYRPGSRLPHGSARIGDCAPHRVRDRRRVRALKCAQTGRPGGN
jgi:hypothetical protein